MRAPLFIFSTLALAHAWQQTTRIRSRPIAAAAARHLRMMAIPDGLTDGFLGDANRRAEAEKDLGVVISSDESLWEANAFPNDGNEEWRQVAIDRVVVISTYLLLKYVAKLRLCFTPDNRFKEWVDGPIVGRKDHNEWKVYGYVSDTVRVVRAEDGGASYGQWFLMSLEPDSTADLLKYEMMPANGGGCVITLERA